MNDQCSVEGCCVTALHRGWCRTHYERWRRHGDPLVNPRPVGLSLEQRFWRKVDRTDGCWLWMAGRNGAGYGAFSVGKRMLKAHRVAYELSVGPIPDGSQLDHLCHNEAAAAGLCAGGISCVHRACVNPTHLEPTTHAVNVGRGEAGQHHGRKTHCIHGHPFDETNTIYRKRGGRDCRACLHERMRRYRMRLLAAG